MARRLFRVLYRILRPLPALGDWAGLAAAVAFLLGVPAAVAVSLGIGGADRVSSVSWGLAALFAVLLLLAVVAAHGLQGDLDRREEAAPRLQFGDPIEDSRIMIGEKPARMWRIPLENGQPGTQAKNVRVRLHAAEPPLSFLPISLHEMHDNRPRYRQEWNVVYGYPIVFDLIGEDPADPGILHLFRSDGDLDSYFNTITGSLAAQLRSAAEHRDCRLIVRAVPEPPGRGIEQVLRLYLESATHLRLEKAGDSVLL